MLRNLVLTLLTFAIATGGGAASVWYALNANDGIDALRVGAWTAFPDLGTPDANPYAKAAAARNGVLALGRAEGLAFVADRDSSGGTLNRGCTYSIVGNTAPARFWTLFAMDPGSSLPLKAASADLPDKLQSWTVARQADASFAVIVGPHPSPGNWLAVNGSGPMSLALTLYDTPIAASSEIESVALPKIHRVSCGG